jgi:hypothetical protein
MEDDMLVIATARTDAFAAVTVAVTAAVVVLALALVGHAHGPVRASPPASGKPAAPSTVPAQNPAHTVRDVLSAHGIGPVAFGQSRASVIAGITSLLGPTSTGYTRVQAECGVDHTMTWPNWSARRSHSPLDPVLTIFFAHSRFVGYQYGQFGTASAPRVPAHGTALATIRGLNIADMLARGRQLYGGAFRLSSAQGGVWKVDAPGRLRGYAWGTPTYGDVSPQSLVATIDAGDVGCPALSP